MPIYLCYGWSHVNGDCGVKLGRFKSFANAVQLIQKWNNNHTIWRYYFMPQHTEYDEIVDHTKEFLFEKPVEFFLEIPK